MGRKGRTLSAALLLIGLLLPTTGAWGFDFSTIENRIHEFTLDNGLTVIVYEDHSAPVVTCVTYADVGSVDDPKGATGMAHMFEHMAFKGTTEIGTKDPKKEANAIEKVDVAFHNLRAELLKVGGGDSAKVERLRAALKAAQDEAGEYVVTNEFGRIVEREGGVGLNAGTGTDQTVYFFSLPSNRVELWFALESGRFYDPVFREFYRERDVVMEERRMRVESSPIGKLVEEFMGVGFKAHPYGIRGIGHMSDLKMMTREEAKTFFAKYYVPSNLVVAVAGDVTPDQIEKLAKTYFGRIKPAPKPERIGTVEPPQNGERRVALEDRAQPFWIAGFHRPAETDADDAALSALADYLGQGRTSLLYKKLVKEDKIAVDAGGFSSFPGSKYPNMFAVYAVPAKGVTALECEKAVFDEIEKLKSTPIPAEEVEKIKARARAQFINALSSRQGMAMQLAGMKTAYGDWRELFRQLDKINAVTADDITRVANQYLTKTNRSVGYIETTDES